MRISATCSILSNATPTGLTGGLFRVKYGLKATIGGTFVGALVRLVYVLPQTSSHNFYPCILNHFIPSFC